MINDAPSANDSALKMPVLATQKSVKFSKVTKKESNEVSPVRTSIKTEKMDSTIENERLKTNIMVLNQKLKVLLDIEENANKYKNKNQEAEEEIFQLKDD